MVNKYLFQDGNYIKTYNVGILNENRVPAMTSNTTPSGIASASYEYDENNKAYQAFSHIYPNGNNCWYTEAYKSGWLAYEFPNEEIINKYAIVGTNSKDFNPREWTFEGYDGSTWVVLDTQNYSRWTSSQYERVEFSINNTVAFKKYRINITKTNGAGQAGIIQLELIYNGILGWQTVGTYPPTKELFDLYGMTEPIITEEALQELSNDNLFLLNLTTNENSKVRLTHSKADFRTVSSTLPTSQQFISDGMDSLSPLLDRKVTTLESQPMTDESEILQGEEGKVFSKTLDLKKYIDIRSVKIKN